MAVIPISPIGLNVRPNVTEESKAGPELVRTQPLPTEELIVLGTLLKLGIVTPATAKVRRDIST
jgi:hypothetical protein